MYSLTSKLWHLNCLKKMLLYLSNKEGNDKKKYNLIYSCLFDTCNVYYILFNNKIKFTLNNNLQNTAENTKDRATVSCVIKYYRGNDILQSDSLELSA